MRRLLQLLARLYPAEWRARYGAEYAALLEEREPRWRDVVDVAWAAVKMQMTSWRFVRVVLPCVLAGGLVAVVLSFKAPVLYTSGSVVVAEAPNPGDGSAPDVGVESQGPQIPELARSAFADQEAMVRIIDKYNLYPAERAKMPMDRVVEKMRSEIRVRRVWGTALDQEIARLKQRPGVDPENTERLQRSIRSAFTVEFEYPDPHIAQRVDAELLGLVVRETLQLRISSAAAGGHGTLTVMNAPTLPERPNRVNRAEFGAFGLLGGLAGGLALVAAIGWRRRVDRVELPTEN
jgi:hypothetical protein